MHLAKILLFFTIYLLLTLCTVWYIRQEQYLYFWDYANYHGLYRKLGARLRQSPLKAISTVISSVRKSDYNILPALFQMPFYFSFGSSRFAYILSIVVLFAFPAIALFTRLMGEFDTQHRDKKEANAFVLTFISTVVIGLSPQFWTPVVLGYVDVIGVIVIFTVLMLYFRKDLADQTSRDILAQGLLLSLLILLRRWYAYWVVGFLFAMCITTWAGIHHNDGHPIEKLRLGFRNALMVSVIAVLILFAVATPIAVRMSTTDYRDIYSAYRESDSVLPHFLGLIHHYGLWFLATSSLGLVKMATTEGKKLIALFLIVQCIVTFFLFTRTQSIGVHHHYGISVILSIFTAFFWQNLYLELKTHLLKAVFISSLSVTSVLNLLIVFYPDISNRLGPVGEVFSQIRRYPLKRQDLDRIHNLLHTLNSLTRFRRQNLCLSQLGSLKWKHHSKRVPQL